MAVEVYSLPASTTLLNEINEIAPDRDKRQDGTIGDTAHERAVSDHNLDETGNTGKAHDDDRVNEVHARDVDSRGPWPHGWSMWRIVLFLVARCVAGTERRFRYIIFDGWIWEASNGWRKRAHTGADKHRTHAHFSFTYGSGPAPGNPEQVKTPYGLAAAYRKELSAPPALEDELPTSEDLIKDVRNAPKFLSDTTMIDTGKWTLKVFEPVLNQILAMLAGEAAETPPTVGQIAAAVLGALADLPSAADKARLLQQLLGADAAEVGRILAGQAPSPAKVASTLGKAPGQLPAS